MVVFSFYTAECMCCKNVVLSKFHSFLWNEDVLSTKLRFYVAFFPLLEIICILVMKMGMGLIMWWHTPTQSLIISFCQLGYIHFSSVETSLREATAKNNHKIWSNLACLQRASLTVIKLYIKPFLSYISLLNVYMTALQTISNPLHLIIWSCWS